MKAHILFSCWYSIWCTTFERIDPSFERGKTDIRAEKNNHLSGIILKKLNYYN